MGVLHSLSGNINYFKHFIWQLMLLNNPTINFSLATLAKINTPHMQFPSNVHSKWIHKTKSAWKLRKVYFPTAIHLNPALGNAGWKAWEGKENERGWLSMGGCRDLPRWAVSRCCAVLSATSTGTVPWDSLHEELGGKCCQLHLGAEKLSRAGLVKLTLIASISVV